MRSSRSASKQADSDESEEEESNSLGDTGEDVYARRPRRHHRSQERSYNDFRVDILEFEGKLDSNLPWIDFKPLKESLSSKTVPKKRRLNLLL